LFQASKVLSVPRLSMLFGHIQHCSAAVFSVQISYKENLEHQVQAVKNCLS